jgi:hypothetical protein
MRDLATNPSNALPALSPDAVTYNARSADADDVDRWVANVLADLKANPTSKHLLAVDLNCTVGWKEATACYSAWMTATASLLVKVWNSTTKRMEHESVGVASMAVDVNVLYNTDQPYTTLGARLLELLKGTVAQNIANGKLDHVVAWDRTLCKEIVSEAVRDEIRTEAVLELVDEAKASLAGGQPQKNDMVEVYKGRKVPVGTVGKVKWVGTNRFGTSVGLEVGGTTANGLIFTSYGNVRRIVDGNTAVQVAKEQYTELGYDKVFGPIREAA